MASEKDKAALIAMGCSLTSGSSQSNHTAPGTSSLPNTLSPRPRNEKGQGKRGSISVISSGTAAVAADRIDESSLMAAHEENGTQATSLPPRTGTNVCVDELNPSTSPPSVSAAGTDRGQGVAGTENGEEEKFLRKQTALSDVLSGRLIR